MKLLIAAACLLSLCCTNQLSAYADNQAWNDGIEQLQAKRYHAASDCFQRAIEKEPGVQKYHLYLGISLESANERDAAHDAYANAFRLNPFSTEGNMAKQKLLQLEATVTRQQHPTDNPALYDQALQLIDSQTADNQGRWFQWGAAEANFQRRLGAIEVGKIQRQSGQYFNDYRDDVAHGYSLTVSEAQAQMNFIHLDSQVSALRYQETAMHAATETQSSANLLKQLLSEPYRPGEPHLRALGTNLYVRNYAPFDYDDAPYVDPPIEMKATSKSLAQLPIELHAVPLSFDDLAKKQPTGERP